LKEILKGIAS